MLLGEKGKQLIKSFEGCYLEAYLCPSNVWTIGWGHTNGVYEGMKITQEQADLYFENDISIYEYYVNCYNITNQNQFDALVSFTYNCGRGALEDVMSSGDITGTMSLYIRGNNREILQGLVRRRKEEIKLYNEPIEVVKEVEVLMENAICYCNEVDKTSAETLGKLMNWDVLDARIPKNWKAVAKNIIAVGSDNPKKGEVGQYGFSGATTVYLKGKDRKETLEKVLEYARNNK